MAHSLTVGVAWSGCVSLSVLVFTSLGLIYLVNYCAVNPSFPVNASTPLPVIESMSDWSFTDSVHLLFI